MAKDWMEKEAERRAKAILKSEGIKPAMALTPKQMEKWSADIQEEHSRQRAIECEILKNKKPETASFVEHDTTYATAYDEYKFIK